TEQEETRDRDRTTAPAFVQGVKVGGAAYSTLALPCGKRICRCNQRRASGTREPKTNEHGAAGAARQPQRSLRRRAALSQQRVKGEQANAGEHDFGHDGTRICLGMGRNPFAESGTARRVPTRPYGLRLW